MVVKIKAGAGRRRSGPKECTTTQRSTLLGGFRLAGARKNRAAGVGIIQTKMRGPHRGKERLVSLNQSGRNEAGHASQEREEVDGKAVKRQ